MKNKVQTLAGFLTGIIFGLIIGHYLPPDVINNYANQIRLKNKKGSINDSNINQTSAVIEPEKRKGIFKRIFKRKVK